MAGPGIVYEVTVRLPGSSQPIVEQYTNKRLMIEHFLSFPVGTKVFVMHLAANIGYGLEVGEHGRLI